MKTDIENTESVAGADSSPLPCSAFSAEKPTNPGRYIWKLPESEKPGYYQIEIEIVDEGDKLMIYDEYGIDICTVEEAGTDTFWADMPNYQTMAGEALPSVDCSPSPNHQKPTE